jgi:DeoR family deoxyribose operon repressor
MGDLSAFDVIASDRRPDDELTALAKQRGITLLFDK